MHQIQMVDLKRQYAHIKTEVDAAIQNVIDTTAFIGGPEVNQFATELATYLGVKHVIPCANGTDALQIALMALGLQPGDEVITPSFTYVATVEVVALLRLQPVFVDVNEDSFTMDTESLRNAITDKTKAIIPVHLYGQCANMEEILAIAAEKGIPVIEDNAQAIGGDYTFSDGRKARTGTMGTIGTTSFFPSKNLGCYGDGGAIFTNDDKLAEDMKMIANHGQKVRYYHEMVGCNSRLDAIQAAVLRIKLRRLDQYCDARRKVADYYDKAFAGHPNIETPFRDANNKHVFHQYTLKLKGVNRDALHDALAARNVPSMIYYPVPCHKQNMFKAMGGSEFHLPVTDSLQDRVISLPIHTELTEEELQFISNHFLEAIKELTR
ncbi:MAG: DegT/DnrJ/EryC1/StrS family aminotransferase [Sphingobacteriales bacterium]|nr:MAG: DegT/DnrJ/EryC1/StrS family aminotransferase [Sphingobacteriales bacterium]